MNIKTNTRLLIISSVLTAIGILIPIISPIKITLEPASYTLASHVAIFIAIFIAPSVAVSVSIGTALGFWFAGFPIVIVVRAFSHIVFAFIGSMMMKNQPILLQTKPKQFLIGLILSLIHAVFEVIVVLPFYFFGNTLDYSILNIFMLIGIGTIIHSMIDFYISLIIFKPLSKQIK